MSNTLVKLKQDLNFSRDLGDIIDVLKSAALMQLRVFQLGTKPNPAYLKALESVFRLLALKAPEHPYFAERKKLPTAILVITSDEGFLGELNTLLMNSCLDQRQSEDDEIIVLGERGVRYLEDAGEKFVAFPGLSGEIKNQEIDKIRSHLLSGYHRGRFGRVIVVYAEFVSLTNQKVTYLQILPHPIAKENGTNDLLNYISDNMLLEPSLSGVLEMAVRLWLGFKLFEVFWSNKQSEYAARIMHLEGSTEELSVLNRKLAFDYFRQIHALNDKTIREISASKVLLFGKNYS